MDGIVPVGVSIAEAAAQIGRSEATIRRWVAEGAPCVSPGTPGRGRGAIVNVAALRRWKAAGHAPAVAHAEWLAILAEGMLAYHRTETYRKVGLSAWQHAAYLHDLFACIAARVGSDLEPPEIKLLEFIFAQERPR